MSKLDDLISEVSVTRRLVAVATDRAGATALVGGAPAGGAAQAADAAGDGSTALAAGPGCYSYGGFAVTVQLRRFFGRLTFISLLPVSSAAPANCS